MKNLNDQPFDLKHRHKLPLNYYLFRSFDSKIKDDKIEKYVVSAFHNTDVYAVGNIYRPISNIL
jgi:hypothetical protein